MRPTLFHPHISMPSTGGSHANALMYLCSFCFISHSATAEPAGAFCEVHEMPSVSPCETFCPDTGEETSMEVPEVEPPTVVVTVPTICAGGNACAQYIPAGHWGVGGW